MNATRYWSVRPELAQETEAHYRDKILARLANLSPLEKVKLVTFDGVAPGLKPEEARSLLAFIDTKVSPGSLGGTGLELGAGAGFFSALLASLPKVAQVYAVEISRPIVDNLLPEIVRAFAAGEENKVVPCVGDFAHLELPDRSADFAFDFFSLHHSDDLAKTFAEAARVLKSGGKLVCLDKARADALSGADLDRLLDREYSAEAKRLMGLDPAVRQTRRMNGEREFRLKDWVGQAEQAGLKLDFFSHVAMTRSGNPLYKFLKEVLAKLPIPFEMALTRLLGFAGRKHPNDLETRNLIFSPRINHFPKEISVMVFKK